MPNCPQCGAELGSGDPAGMCPKCLILGAFDSSAGAEECETETLDSTSAAAGDDDFGRYRIARSLGEGGMGTVYLAEQREPIRRLVALKVVKLGMDTSQILARFNNERQALAVMDHPNIAQIFDAGIAKATDKWAVENTLLTEFGQIVGTPEYASPEQADTITGAIDELSDIYSLGVVLYELLIGAVPFETATLRGAGLAEMLRII